MPLAALSVLLALTSPWWSGDPDAERLGAELAARGVRVAEEPEQRMDGGYRGALHLVPARPVGARRVQLGWIAAAIGDHVEVLRRLTAGAAAPIRWRAMPEAVTFFVTVSARTPSAFAYDWTVAYNLDGSINTSADAVRETLFHEMFHLNDAHHDGWSARALAPIRAGIVSRCGAHTECLRPFAPGDTRVRGGTYYAFQPGNGVGEYGAELALRYYREQRAALAGKTVAAPFKCGPPENARAWTLLVTEFFAGIDKVPACA